MSPDEALTKVARDMQWTPGFLRTAVSAFNTGRQVGQWKANDTIMSKLASFDLADYNKIKAEIWGGGKEKKASAAYSGPRSIDYMFPPSFIRDDCKEWLDAIPYEAPATEKRASDTAALVMPSGPTSVSPNKVWREQNRLKRAFDESRARFNKAHDDVRLCIRELETYFHKAAMDRLPFAAVQYAAETYYGEPGRVLFDVLKRSSSSEKRASESSMYVGPMNRKAAPFTWIERAIDAAQEIGRSKQAMDDAYSEMEKVANSPFVQAPPTAAELLSGFSIEKSGSVLDMIGGAGIKAMLDTTIGGDPASRRDKAWTELEDPEHENELRSIQTQALLGGMLNDPKNPVSGYPRDRVLSAYNDIAALAPRVASQRAALQPLLAKQLAGHTEPFEAKEMIDMEKAMRETEAPTPLSRSLLDGPDSLLG